MNPHPELAQERRNYLERFRSLLAGQIQKAKWKAAEDECSPTETPRSKKPGNVGHCPEPASCAKPGTAPSEPRRSCHEQPQPRKQRTLTRIRGKIKNEADLASGDGLGKGPDAKGQAITGIPSIINIKLSDPKPNLSSAPWPSSNIKVKKASPGLTVNNSSLSKQAGDSPSQQPVSKEHLRSQNLIKITENVPQKRKAFRNCPVTAGDALTSFPQKIINLPTAQSSRSASDPILESVKWKTNLSSADLKHGTEHPSSEKKAQSNSSCYAQKVNLQEENEEARNQYVKREDKVPQTGVDNHDRSLEQVVSDSATDSPVRSFSVTGFEEEQLVNRKNKHRVASDTVLTGKSKRQDRVRKMNRITNTNVVCCTRSGKRVIKKEKREIQTVHKSDEEEITCTKSSSVNAIEKNEELDDWVKCMSMNQEYDYECDFHISRLLVPTGSPNQSFHLSILEEIEQAEAQQQARMTPLEDALTDQEDNGPEEEMQPEQSPFVITKENDYSSICSSNNISCESTINKSGQLVVIGQENNAQILSCKSASSDSFGFVTTSEFEDPEPGSCSPQSQPEQIFNSFPVLICLDETGENECKNQGESPLRQNVDSYDKHLTNKECSKEGIPVEFADNHLDSIRNHLNDLYPYLERSITDEEKNAIFLNDNLIDEFDGNELTYKIDNEYTLSKEQLLLCLMTRNNNSLPSPEKKRGRGMKDFLQVSKRSPSRTKQPKGRDTMTKVCAKHNSVDSSKPTNKKLVRSKSVKSGGPPAHRRVSRKSTSKSPGRARGEKEGDLMTAVAVNNNSLPAEEFQQVPQINNNSLDTPIQGVFRRAPGQEPCKYYFNQKMDADYLVEYTYKRKKMPGTGRSRTRRRKGHRSTPPDNYGLGIGTPFNSECVHPPDCTCLEYDCLRRRGEMLHDHVMKNLNVLKKYAESAGSSANFTIKIKEASGDKAVKLIQNQKAIMGAHMPQNPDQAITHTYRGRRPTPEYGRIKYNGYGSGPSSSASMGRGPISPTSSYKSYDHQVDNLKYPPAYGGGRKAIKGGSRGRAPKLTTRQQSRGGPGQAGSGPGPGPEHGGVKPPEPHHSPLIRSKTVSEDRTPPKSPPPHDLAHAPPDPSAKARVRRALKALLENSDIDITNTETLFKALVGKGLIRG